MSEGHDFRRESRRMQYSVGRTGLVYSGDSAETKVTGVQMKNRVCLMIGLSSLCSIALADPDFAALELQSPDMQQLVEVKATSSHTTTVQFWIKSETSEDTPWQKSGPEVQAVVGVNGTITSDDKREGDGKTPKGFYPLLRMFGASERSDLRMPYTELTREDKWIDDPKHADYNTYVRGATTARSFERLLRNDHQYDLFAVVGYNVSPVVAGRGSAIFLHVWRRPGNGTAGCVAMARADLEIIARQLDPEKQPHILIQ